MNKDDKFIKEKLDIATKLDKDDLPVPESLRAEYQALTLSFPVADNKPQPKRLKSRWIATLSTAAIALAVVLPCALLIPKQSEDQPYYNDTDLQSYVMSYEEAFIDYGFLYPDTTCYDANYYISKDIKTEVPVFATMDFALEYGDLDITVVLVNNYKIIDLDTYNNKVTEPAETALIQYAYKIYEGIALAKCDNNGYKYYFKYKSDTPEKLFDVMSTLTLK